MRLFALLFTNMLAASCAASTSYVYTSHAASESYHFGVDSLVLDPTSGFIMTKDGHGRERMRDCSDQNFHCFSSNSMLFSVPKLPLAVGDEWRRKDQPFRVERSIKLSALGNALEVSVISSQRSVTRQDSFYFSSDRGLVGIKIEDTDPKLDYVRFLLLESDVGYPFQALPKRP